MNNAEKRAAIASIEYMLSYWKEKLGPQMYADLCVRYAKDLEQLKK